MDYFVAFVPVVANWRWLGFARKVAPGSRDLSDTRRGQVIYAVDGRGAARERRPISEAIRLFIRSNRYIRRFLGSACVIAIRFLSTALGLTIEVSGPITRLERNNANDAPEPDLRCRVHLHLGSSIAVPRGRASLLSFFLL